MHNTAVLRVDFGCFFGVLSELFSYCPFHGRFVQESAHVCVTMLGPLRVRRGAVQSYMRHGWVNVLLGMPRRMPEPDFRERVQRRLQGRYLI